MDTWSAAIMLFLIMDPLGNLPVFMSVLKSIEPKRRQFIMIRELLFALGILFLFLFVVLFLLPLSSAMHKEKKRELQWRLFLPSPSVYISHISREHLTATALYVFLLLLFSPPFKG